ncbi:AGE family epimerase/isomerase [Saccharicrinis aurantiacus]|uniref:AGE family epimerase/isomerase n=1 Tax=Saccharicrinis aurantiacus TaxID=1849719 RepID=UPI00094FB878|nr:AGE family epimerase/isomerase [Saccharicrinis aurantiacus]
MKNIFLVLIVAVLLISCTSEQKFTQAFFKEDMARSLSFFDKAYDGSKMTYYSEIDFKGQVISSKIYTVALSRLIYGLAFSAHYYPENIDRALSISQFQLNNMIGEESGVSYFKPEFPTGAKEIPNKLDIWQQAYGLCGLTELYRQTNDTLLLSKLRTYHKSLVKRFRDSINGGFFGEVQFNGEAISGTKTIQSLMYPLTAYLINLREADVYNRNEYESILEEHLSIAYQKVWNSSTSWVNVKFDDDWNPIDTDSASAFVTAGHNFQFAALMLRAGEWSFLKDSTRFNYQKLGEKVIAETVQKNIWKNQLIEHGFYAGFNPHTNKGLDDNRTWWQHCEAIIALTLCGDKYKAELNQLLQFYYSNFIDTQYGGEIFNIDANGNPVNENKGQKGKSVYHHIEMLRFLLEAS